LILHIDPDKEACWTSGTTLNDLSSENNDGTLVNGATVTDDLTYGKIISLDGSNDYVNIPHSTSLNHVGATSVEIWARWQGSLPTSNKHKSLLAKGRIHTSGTYTSIAPYAISLANGSNSGNSMRFTWGGEGSSDDVRAVMYINRGNRAYFDLGLPNTVTNWHQYVMTWDGTAGTNNNKLYKDGLLIGQRTYDVDGDTSGYAWSPLELNDTTYFLALGRDPMTTDNGGRYWSGDIGLVRIYDDCLTSTEVGDNYDTNKSRFGLS